MRLLHMHALLPPRLHQPGVSLRAPVARYHHRPLNFETAFQYPWYTR